MVQAQGPEAHTPARVTGMRITGRPQAGRCQYCGKAHQPPLSYWYTVYSYLANW
jgi:hypothetical protein